MKNFKLLLVTLSLIVCLNSSALAQSTPQIVPDPPIGKGTVVLKAARLIDGTGAPAINNAVVVVTDNKIVAVGISNSVASPADAKVIDLGNVTLLQGFIDATSIKLAGKSIAIFALLIVTFLSSIGWRITSSTVRLNSGSSSRKSTPL